MLHDFTKLVVANTRLFDGNWEDTGPSGTRTVTVGRQGSSGAVHTAFFRFGDFEIPPYANIISATFKFYVSGGTDNSGRTYTISGVKDNGTTGEIQDDDKLWTESTRNGAGRDTSVTASVYLAKKTGEWRTANIIKIAEAWRDGLLVANRGISITHSGTDSYKIIDGRMRSNAPSLTIVYEVPASIPSVDKTTVALGETLTVTINPVEEGASHVVNYKIDEDVLYSDDIGLGTESTFTPPLEDDLGADPPVYCAGNYFPNDISAALTVEVVTTVGGENRGAVTLDAELTLPADAAPTATATPSRLIVDTIPPISNFIQNKTGVIFAMAGVPKYGATIDSYSLTIEGVTKTGASITRIPLTSSGNVGYSFTVTDSRQLSRTYTGGYISVMPWQPPTFSVYEIKRVNSSGTEVLDGWYARPTISASANSLLVGETEYNELEYYIAYRKIALEGEPEASWSISDTVSISTATYSSGKLMFSGGGILTSGGVPISTFDDMIGYEFNIFFSDYFATIQDYDEMPTKEIIMDIYSDAASVAIGGDSTATPKIGDTPAHKKFEVYPEAHFYGGLFDGDGNEIGLTAYSTDHRVVGKWIDGKPIYRKVLPVGAVGSSATVDVPLEESAIDAVVGIGGMLKNSTGNWYPLANTSSSTLNGQTTMALFSPAANPYVRLVAGSSGARTGGYIIVDYTLPD